ncbi:MAG: acyltransferase [Frankiales bacterium]|nr:acyltransferase [Frankiales bacterium]
MTIYVASLMTGRPLPSLTGWRAVAAVIVFGDHALGVVSQSRLSPLRHLFGQGQAALSFFFILSGFVLVWSRHEKDSHRRYFQRRIARIVPNHWLGWALSIPVIVLVEHGRVSPGPAVTNLFLVQSWVPSVRYYFSMDAPSWSLAVEAVFYALLPFVLPLLLRMSRRTRLLMMCGAALATVAIAAAGSTSPFLPNLPDTARRTTDFWWVYILPLARLPEFLFGSLLALEVADGRLRAVPRYAAVLAAVGGYFAAGLVSTSAFSVSAITLLPFSLLIAASAHGDLERRGWLISSGWVVRLGEWTYAFYLVHQLVLRIFYVWQPAPSTSASRAALEWLLLLLISTALGAAMHQFWERPLEARLRRWKPDARPAAAGIRGV